MRMAPGRTVRRPGALPITYATQPDQRRDDQEHEEEEAADAPHEVAPHPSAPLARPTAATPRPPATRAADAGPVGRPIGDQTSANR